MEAAVIEEEGGAAARRSEHEREMLARRPDGVCELQGQDDVDARSG